MKNDGLSDCEPDEASLQDLKETPEQYQITLYTYCEDESGWDKYSKFIIYHPTDLTPPTDLSEFFRKQLPTPLCNCPAPMRTKNAYNLYAEEKLKFGMNLKDWKDVPNEIKKPYEDKAKEIVDILKKCPNVFSKPARRCIDLIQKINQEFPGQSYSYELDLMLANIHNLAENNQTLYERSLEFGTQEQKGNMQAIISQQINAIKNTLNTLKSFSGNLTLIAASQEQSVVATDELKYINQGLQEVIEEFDT